MKSAHCEPNGLGQALGHMTRAPIEHGFSKRNYLGWTLRLVSSCRRQASPLFWEDAPRLVGRRSVCLAASPAPSRGVSRTTERPFQSLLGGCSQLALPWQGTSNVQVRPLPAGEFWPLYSFRMFSFGCFGRVDGREQPWQIPTRSRS